MLLKKLIIFCLVCCTVSASAEIVLQSGVKYNFSKTPFGSSSKGDLTWGDEANALNVIMALLVTFTLGAWSIIDAIWTLLFGRMIGYR